MLVKKGLTLLTRVTELMPGQTRRRVAVVLACLATLVAGLALPRPALAQTIESKRAQAASLSKQIASNGEALSIADEQYNQARIARQAIDTKANAAKQDVQAASDRWVGLKQQLATRVRMLYMHPGAALDAWLSEKSLSDLARARKLGSAVLTADADLVMKTEKARQEVIGRANRLEGLQDQAKGKEVELADRRADVSHAVAGQKALLGKVNGEIASLMEQQRQRELAAAEAAAKNNSSSGSSGSSTGGSSGGGLLGGGGSSGGGSSAPEEPTGPPPPVKAGAGTALQVARDQIGKPYEWAADGPDTFDCSGLTMYAWGKAGVSLPHSSGAQFASLPHVARAQLQPGDLVFFGSPIHHVGIYEGGGIMIDAPETGENVRRDSIGRADYTGAARP